MHYYSKGKRSRCMWTCDYNAFIYYIRKKFNFNSKRIKIYWKVNFNVTQIWNVHIIFILVLYAITLFKNSRGPFAIRLIRIKYHNHWITFDLWWSLYTYIFHIQTHNTYTRIRTHTCTFHIVCVREHASIVLAII